MNFNYLSYANTFLDIQSIVSHMQKLNDELFDTELQNLIAFNTTYLIITQAVAAKFTTGYFDNDEQMEQLDIIFAKYYFDALHNYIHGNSCAPAWRMLFEVCKKDNLHQWQYMALGVNAHVNNDLPFALRDAHIGIEYRNDFNKINHILFAQIPSVIHSFSEKDSTLNMLKNNAVYLYRFGLILIIWEWRRIAWLNYQKLLRSPHHADQIAHFASMAAARFGAR